ncbi:MAG: ACP S-malonyltransferase [Christensenellales bacterium]
MKTAFIFPGQGAQFPGMGNDLYEKYDIVRTTFEEAEDALAMPIRSICFDGDSELLSLTENTQPCMVTLEVAIARLAEQLGLKADIVCGFSLGECAAAIVSGALDFKDGLRLVSLRAKAMQRCVPPGVGGMSAIIGPDALEVEKMCEKAKNDVWAANYNCPGQTVVSGSVEGVAEVESMCAEGGIMFTRLNVSIPSHCPLMQPAAEEFKAFANSMEFHKPLMPVAANTDASLSTEPDEVKDRLIEQLTLPVRFESCIRRMSDEGVKAFVELGPGKVLGGFVKRTLGRGVKIMRIGDIKTLEDTLSALL